MSTFNSLSYATQLVATGLPREQAEVHANALKNIEINLTQVEKKIERVELKLSSEQSIQAKTIDQCKKELSNFRIDVVVLKTSHKYSIWGGVILALCLSVIGINISMFMFLAK
mgnify:CR=1 FL=1